MNVLLIGILLTALLLIVIIIKASREPESVFEEESWETKFQQNGKLSGKTGIVRRR